MGGWREEGRREGCGRVVREEEESSEEK